MMKSSQIHLMWIFDESSAEALQASNSDLGKNCRSRSHWDCSGSLQDHRGWGKGNEKSWREFAPTEFYLEK